MSDKHKDVLGELLPSGLTAYNYEPWVEVWTRDEVERIQRKAYEAGRASQVSAAAPANDNELLRLVNEYRHACDMVQGHAIPQWREVLAYVAKIHASEGQAQTSNEGMTLVAEMVELDDGFDGYPNTIFCDWNGKLRAQLPAGTKIYAAQLADSTGGVKS